jgi:hypothetical protein
MLAELFLKPLLVHRLCGRNSVRTPIRTGLNGERLQGLIIRKVHLSNHQAARYRQNWAVGISPEFHSLADSPGLNSAVSIRSAVSFRSAVKRNTAPWPAHEDHLTATTKIALCSTPIYPDTYLYRPCCEINASTARGVRNRRVLPSAILARNSVAERSVPGIVKENTLAAIS